MAINDQPVVVDFTVGKDAMVWPMVAAGTSATTTSMAARDIRPVFDAELTVTERSTMSNHTLSVLVENKPGVLARVSGPVLRAAGSTSSRWPSAPPSTPRSRGSRSWSSVEGNALEQVTKQLNKLINVLKIVELEPEQAVQRELLLVKVRADETTRRGVLETVELFQAQGRRRRPRGADHRARPAARTSSRRCSKMLEPYGIREMVQSGMVALGRGPRSMTQAALRAVERDPR